MKLLQDKFGREVNPGDWFIRYDQNHEGRLYLCEGYADDGRIQVHEHVMEYDRTESIYSSKLTGRILPKRLKQTIVLPRNCIWYPQALIPEIGPREQ